MTKSKINKFDLLKFILPLAYLPFFYWFNRSLLQLALYGLGWYLGLGLLILDKQVLYKYYYHRIKKTKEQFAKLITRSLLFMLALVVLTIFMVTSTGSNLGKGLVIGIGLGLSIEMWQSRHFVKFFNQYFIQAHTAWTQREIMWLVYGFISFWLVMSVFSIF